jgi:hypothetical protein
VCSPAQGQRVQVQTFQAPGGYVYMPSSGLVTAVVECQAAGGGGGGAQSSIPSAGVEGWLQSGGGGASGGYSKKTLDVSLVRGGVNLVVGAGGAGGSPTTAGMMGGDTSFGAFCLAKGGGGGQPGFGIESGGASAVGDGGARNQVAPGQAGVGDIATYGNGGEPGDQTFYDPTSSGAAGQLICFGGRGGGSHFQSAETAAVQQPAGSPGGTGYFGAGGGGAVGGGQGPGPQAGGMGGDGLLIVTEYCWADVGSDCLDPCADQGAARIAAPGREGFPYEDGGV